MTRVEFSVANMKRFVEALAHEIGADTLAAVLSKSGLPKDWANPAHFSALDGERAAQAYSRLQASLRAYYGRGARGILMRIGTNLWQPLLADAPLFAKLQMGLIRLLPPPMRIRPAVSLLARLLAAHKGDVSLHSLDLDLLFVDRASPATQNQTDDAPICFVTLGLLRECLFWADGREHDIEERACRAAGAHQCEFKITIGG